MEVNFNDTIERFDVELKRLQGELNKDGMILLYNYVIVSDNWIYTVKTIRDPLTKCYVADVDIDRTLPELFSQNKAYDLAKKFIAYANDKPIVWKVVTREKYYTYKMNELTQMRAMLVNNISND